MRSLFRRLDRWAVPLGAVGFVGVVLYNWHLWQQDKKLLAEKGTPPPLPPLEDWPALPLVSVLVAARNEADFIERHIESFLSLRYPHKELVLCAGGEDGTFELASRYVGPQVKVLHQESGEGKQRALARAFDETRGEVIFFTDADCLLADEPFERTVWPVVTGEEQVATGSSQPLGEQVRDPFAFTQAATQVYSAMRGPKYAPGILGRNCAVARSLLQATAALDAPAPTGTDYVLAKTLDAAGVRIRQVPESRMLTEFPSTACVYLRQQRRWLRNVVVHGRRFGATDEVRAALRTSVTGLVMLLLPGLGALLSPWLIVVWSVLYGQALAARFRYMGFAGAVFSRQVRARDVVVQSPLLVLDFVAWAQPLVDYVRQRDRWGW